MQGNYERILEKISKASGIDKSEIENMVEARRSKLSGLISREGAAQVIASELGVSFENEKLKIDELARILNKSRSEVEGILNTTDMIELNLNERYRKEKDDENGFISIV